MLLITAVCLHLCVPGRAENSASDFRGRLSLLMDLRNFQLGMKVYDSLFDSHFAGLRGRSPATLEIKLLVNTNR